MAGPSQAYLDMLAERAAAGTLTEQQKVNYANAQRNNRYPTGGQLTITEGEFVQPGTNPQGDIDKAMATAEQPPVGMFDLSAFNANNSTYDMADLQSRINAAMTPELQAGLEQLNTAKSQALLGAQNTGGQIVSDKRAQAVNDVLGIDRPVDSYTNLATGQGASGSSFLDTAQTKEDALAYLAEQEKPLVRDDGKVYSFGNDDINQAVYGDMEGIKMSELSGRGEGYVTPQKTGLGPIQAGLGLMSLIAGPAAFGAISGALPGAATATTGATLANTALAGGALGAGTTAAGQFVNQDFDAGDIASAALTGAGSSVLNTGMLNDYIPGYAAQNVGGSAVRGVTNDAIMQAIQNGDIDFKDALQAGLINVGMDTAGDVFGDARQTNDGNLTAGVDTLDGNLMTQADVDRLTNTTDLYGVLGEQGLLSKLGLDVGYMPTDWLGAGLDLIGAGGRPIVNQAAAQEEYTASIEGIAEDPSLTYTEKLDAVQAAKDKYTQDTSRYDERFFDLTTERGDAPFTGIYENNPLAGSGSSVSTMGGQNTGSGSTSGSGYGEGTLPSAPTATTATPITDSIFEPEAPQLPQEPDYVTEEELLGDIGETGDLPTVGGGTGDTGELPSGSTTETPDLPAANSGATTDPVGETQVDDLPAAGGGGGGTLPAYVAQFRTLGDVDKELFRLARIPKVVRLDAAGFAELQTAMRALQGRRAAITEGDVTAAVDPESGDYISREEETETNRMQA